MSSGLSHKLHELDRQRRALRRRVAIESVIGVAAIAVAAAAIGWFAAVYLRQSPPVPATTSVAVQPDAAEPTQLPLPVPQPADSRRDAPRDGGFERVQAPPVRREPHPPVAQAARIGPFEITVERALVTHRVLTEFFGIPATESDPALVLELRITNRGPDRVVYRSLRGAVSAATAGVTLVDGLGVYYPALDYGAVPRGGVDSVSLGPGGSVRDVLCFRAVERGVAALDMVVREGLLGPTGATIRIPPERMVFESHARVERDTRPERERETEPQRVVTPPPRPHDPDQPDPAATREHAALLTRADAGDVAAQVAVAGNFEQGLGTRRDLIRALGYYRMAAERGFAEGQWHVGRVLRDGVGVASNGDEALRWLLKAAMQDHRKAQWAAAEMLRDGEGVERDPRQAARWLGELVRSGDRLANVELVRLDPEAYIQATSRLRLHRTGPANEVGAAVGAQGRLRDPEGGTWTLVLDTGKTVAVNMASVVGARLKDGLYLEAYGVLEAAGEIDVMHAVVPPARCMVTSARAVAPQGVVPYRQTRYLAEVVVRNTGLQPIDMVTLEIQVRVINTPSRPQTATVPNLQPGETRSIRLEFSMYNPETVTSPACDVLTMDLAW